MVRGNAKLGAVVMAVLLGTYILLLGQTGVVLLLAEPVIAKVMGLLILTFPIVGAWAIYKEFSFGIRVEKLAKRIIEEDAWPDYPIELRPSGRAVPESAVAMFEHYKAQAQAEPENFRTWFSLGIAYNFAGDRRRARQAMLKAIQLAA